MAKHTVVNTELMRTEYDGSVIRSVRIGDTDLDNGVIVQIGALEAGEREVHVMTVAPAATKLDGKKVAILVTPETGKSTYDERHCELDDFYNVAGGIGRALILQSGTDQFAITALGFTADATPDVGKYVEVGANGKLKVVTSTTNAIGKIQDFMNGFYGIELL